MDVKDLERALRYQKAKLDASGVDRTLHRQPAGHRREYDAGYFYGYYDAVVTILESIEKGETGGLNDGKQSGNHIKK